ncbi:YoaK family protein [Microterricola viridarii]|uniref:Uncharacterized membrane protein YoaK, UPF0700 family n=1 Tax=Microterricola viridarii TaxID=412690 RepID=A0A1H1Q0H5_9MICO|nr:YoaK family protein [Microterricola viridarii]SDS16469.1 Uncharacterized membrane protein YoaK, UPF0700 family [Microterricola viridarii]
MTDATRAPFDKKQADRFYLPALLLLTLATGVVDAVSYLALDRVFTGNMTGNVLFIGFALAGEGGIPLLNNTLALAGFLLGALVAARVLRGRRHASRLPTANLVVLVGGAAFTVALAVFWLLVGALDEGAMLGVTAVLALVMGAQAASVRSTGISDVSTIVVTSTLANLAIDSRLSGGPGEKWPRRVFAVVAMGAGGAIGALLLRFTGHGAIPLLVAGLVMLACVLLLHRARTRELAASA